MKYTERDYLGYDPFDGDRDVDVRCRSLKIVKVRKPHDCQLVDLIGVEPHKIKPGELAICDRALVEGEWGSCYACIGCMDKWLDDFLGA